MRRAARTRPANLVGSAHLDRRAVDPDHLDFASGRKIRPFGEPRRIADAHLASTADDRRVERVALADELFGTAVQQRLVAALVDDLADKTPIDEATDQRQYGEQHGLREK